MYEFPQNDWIKIISWAIYIASKMIKKQNENRRVSKKLLVVYLFHLKIHIVITLLFYWILLFHLIYVVKSIKLMSVLNTLSIVFRLKTNSALEKYLRLLQTRRRMENIKLNKSLLPYKRYL